MEVMQHFAEGKSGRFSLESSTTPWELAMNCPAKCPSMGIGRLTASGRQEHLQPPYRRELAAKPHDPF